MKAINETTGKNIADNLVVAGTLLARMKGLLGRDSLPNGEGLLIKPCMGIHTFGMKYPLDIVFLDRENRVVAVKQNMPPNRVSRIYFSAVSVFELPAGTLEGTQVTIGDRVSIG
jgi:uncharacterized membrane protein (UPF0127 family)